MWDLAYILITLAFFAVMLAFLSGCARLGDGSEASRNMDDQPAGGWRSGRS